MKILIAVALVSIAACSSVAGQANRPKLFDFRGEVRSNPPRITSAQSRKVLSSLFPKYLTDARFCKEDVDTSGAEDYLAGMRKAGQIVPDVLDVAPGSFTGPRQDEMAYIISVGECNASHADNFGSKRLAIFAGNKLVLNADVDFKSGILKKTDLDMNGVDELLLQGGDMNQGILIELAALYEVRNRKLVAIQDFQKVLEDSCASLARDSGIEASVIFLGPARVGQMPPLQVENYRSGCGRTKRWRFISKGPLPF
ncbi:MAG TPA: hypothetical protein VJS64_17275 [Pyrinomonadaceae bacterium]|nr:hypothetical protein [Pyrinomonadaceae bacterium]